MITKVRKNRILNTTGTYVIVIYGRNGHDQECIHLFYAQPSSILFGWILAMLCYDPMVLCFVNHFDYCPQGSSVVNLFMSKSLKLLVSLYSDERDENSQHQVFKFVCFTTSLFFSLLLFQPIQRYWGEMTARNYLIYNSIVFSDV